MCASGPACAAHAKGFEPALSSIWRKSNPGQCDSYQNKLCLFHRPPIGISQVHNNIRVEIQRIFFFLVVQKIERPHLVIKQPLHHVCVARGSSKMEDI